MATYTTTLNQQFGSSNEPILVTVDYGEDFGGVSADDDIRITLKLADAANSGTEDMIGVAFEVANDAVGGLSIADITKLAPSTGLSTYTPTSVIGAEAIGSGGSIDPGFVADGPTSPYDIGVKFSEQGSGEGIVQEARFLITGSTDLDAVQLLSGSAFFVRLQSTDGGDDSAKMGGTLGTLPPVFVPNPAINIDKVTNGSDGPEILVGAPVTWTYTVTNTGNVALSNVTVTDDRGVTPVFQSGDADSDGQLDLTETWIYSATGTAVAGNYSNTGTANGSYNTTPVSDTDPSSYFGRLPDYFPQWPQDVSNIVLYFDEDDVGSNLDTRPAPNGDGYVLVKIDDIPGAANDDLDSWVGSVLGYLQTNLDPDLTMDNLLGAAIAGGRQNTLFYAVEGDTNGTLPDPYPPGAPSATGRDNVPGNLIDHTYLYDTVF